MKYILPIAVLLTLPIFPSRLKDKILRSLAVQSQLFTNNLAVCNNTKLNDLEVDGSFDICGVPACDLAHAYTLLFTPTSSDIPRTLVLRDSAGDFAASIITVTGSINFLAQDGNTLTLSASPETDSYTFQLPSNTGLSHYVLTTDGTGVTRWQPVSVTGGLADLNSLVASTQYFTTGTAGTSFTIMSLATTHTFNIPLAETSGVTGGVISNTDYTNFNNAYTTVSAATSLDTPDTLALRNNTGSFAATDMSLGQVTLAPSASTSNYTFTLPANAGTANYLLTTNGSGTTSWQAVSTVGSVTAITAGANISVTGSTIAPTINVANTTQYNVQVGTGSTGFTQVAPSATSGIPLISQGATSNPAFGTATVPGGGTGDTSFTPNGTLCGGTTNTNSLQATSTGTSSYTLTSNGTNQLPTWQAPPALVLLQTLTASNSASLTFTNTVITSSYTTYVVVLSDIIFQTGTVFGLNYSTNNGSSYLSSGYQAAFYYYAYNNGFSGASNSTNSGTLYNNPGNTFSGFLFLNIPQNGNVSYVGKGFQRGSVGTDSYLNLYGNNSTTTTVNNISFNSPGGTVMSGSISLYGIRQ